LARAPAKRINSFIYFIIKTAARIFLAPFFEIQVGGQENIPKEGSFILLPKHQRWEDIPLLGLASPVPLYYVAKNELFLNPLSSWFMGSLGGIPLERRRPMASRSSIKTVVGLVKKGAGVVVFPEGTYYRNCVGSGQVGLIRLIHSQIEVPFIPVGIRYVGKGVRKQVEIKFGKTMSWESSAEPEDFLALAMKEIRVLSGL